MVLLTSHQLSELEAEIGEACGLSSSGHFERGTAQQSHFRGNMLYSHVM